MNSRLWYIILLYACSRIYLYFILNSLIEFFFVTIFYYNFKLERAWRRSKSKIYCRALTHQVHHFNCSLSQAKSDCYTSLIGKNKNNPPETYSKVSIVYFTGRSLVHYPISLIVHLYQIGLEHFFKTKLLKLEKS